MRYSTNILQQCIRTVRTARLERTRESAAAAHPQRVPHHNTPCTSLHTTVHMLYTTTTLNLAALKHARTAPAALQQQQQQQQRQWRRQRQQQQRLCRHLAMFGIGSIHLSPCCSSRISAAALAAAACRSALLFLRCSGSRVAFASDLWQPPLPAVSASSTAAASGSSCVQSVCCVSAASHVELASWRLPDQLLQQSSQTP